MKKLFLTLFALVMAIPSLWAEDFSVDGIYYNITDEANKTVEVTYRGSSYSSYFNEYSGSFTIPSSVTYYGTTYSVSSIGNYAFSGCTGLTSINIPNSVTSIGKSAFYDCTGLTEVTIPESVTSIGNYAFSGTPWYNNQPDGVVYINKVLYEYKGTMPDNTSIQIKEGTLSISGIAFWNCIGLTEVTIPNSVTSMGSQVFSGCTGLTEVTIPNSVTEIGNYAFSGCTGLTTVNFNATNCTSMGIYNLPVFENCTNFTTVNIGENVTHIPNYAFYECTGLTEVTIPNSVTSIGVSAFSGCTGLTTVHFNATNCINMGVIGENSGISPVFWGCTNLTTVTIGENVTRIPDWAFCDCTGLTEVTIGSSVTEIGSQAFVGCTGLTEVHITDLAKWCEIEFSDVDANPLYYAHNLYLNGELVTDLIIPESITTIKDYAFYNCTGLTSVTIPNSVTSIGDHPFHSCTGLTSVTIGNSVTEIGRHPFYRCTGLTKIEVDRNNPNYSSQDGVLYNKDKTKLITYPGSKQGSFVVLNSVTEIGDRAFESCTGLTSVTIPNSVTEIGDYAFRGCI